MLFGSPQATSFLIWEAWPSPTVTPDGVTTIVDSNWNLTLSGQTLVNLLDSWTTPTQSLTVGSDGTIDFTGFYGDYEITIGGQTLDFSLLKGTEDYALVITPGDYNADGMVDAADYVVWRKTLGLAVNLPNRDSENVGSISTGDFNSWREQFGEMSPGGNSSGSESIPEPNAGLLWVAVVVLGTAIRASRRFRT
jgi:hypothetical protein